MKLSVSLFLAMVTATGCFSPSDQALGWRQEYFVDRRLELKIDDLVVDYSFGADGLVRMILRNDVRLSNQLELGWRLADGKLVIFGEHSLPVTMILLKRDEREITVQTSTGQVWTFQSYRDEGSQPSGARRRPHWELE